MNARAPRDRDVDRDAGFTLLEILICVILMGTVMAALSAAVVVSLKTSPAVADRADAAVNVQGLVTWLPQDVDSATPGSFDIAPASTSGCVGTEPGFNVFKMTWREQITSTLDFAVSYRYVPEPVPSDGGTIWRVYCQIGGVRKMHQVSGIIPEWIAGAEPVKVTLLPDSPADADTLIDSVEVLVEPIVGKTIEINATTKNLNETLSNPPPPPPPPTAPPLPTNNPPIAANSTQTVNAGTDVAMSVSASDPDGDALNLALTVIPAGWTVTKSSGLGIVVNAPLTAVGTSGTIVYTVTDTSGASASAAVDVAVVPDLSDEPPSASPSTASTTRGVPVTVTLAASDPENAVLSATVTGAPLGWTVTTAGINVTVTPPNTALAGTTTLNYTVTDPSGGSASSTLAITVTVPPPCVVTGPVLSAPSVRVKRNNPDAIRTDVKVTINIVSGYCVGLSLRYDTGAPNSQYVRSFGDAGTIRSVTLPKHPSPELWTIGTHALDVWDGTSTIIATTNLQVTP